MDISQHYFIGIDPIAGQRNIAYAALDENLRPMALGSGNFEEVLAYVGGQKQAIVAIAAPPRLNRGLIRQQEPSAKGRWKDCRLAEYLLFQREIESFVTPAKASACKAWIRMGLRLHEKLLDLGYEYSLNEASNNVLLEAWPIASFSAWLEGELLPKYSLEGRLQRQLGLYDQGVRVPDAMQFFEEITRHRLVLGQLPDKVPYEAQELGALALAYTAYLYAARPDEIEFIGDSEEGQVVAPTSQMSDN